MMTSSADPLVSVIIPVYNDNAGLSACLAKLSNQADVGGTVEVIVVDNGSDDPVVLPSDVRLALRLVSEPTAGSYRARNAGVKAARGRILAFTDADCLPGRAWLREGARAVSTGDVIAGGSIRVFSRSGRPSAVELYEQALAFRQKRNVGIEGFSVTANLFVPREVFELIGDFRADLPSGGDREWCNRALRSGIRLLYVEGAVIRHPARRDFRALRTKMERVATGHHLLAGRRPWRGRIAEIIRIIAPPLRNLLEIARSRSLSGPWDRIRAAGVAIAAKYIWSLHRLRLRVNRARK